MKNIGRCRPQRLRALRKLYVSALWVLLAVSPSPATAWSTDDDISQRTDSSPAEPPVTPEPSRPLFAGGESSLVALIGDGFVASTEASADVPCLFCTPASIRKPVSFDRGNLLAMRLSRWGGEASRIPGFGFEFGWAGGEGREVKADFMYLALLPMLRLPLLATPSTPDGRLNFYAGVGLAVSGGGKATLADNTLPHDVSGSPRGSGTTTVIGVRWRQGRYIASLERHSLDLGLSFSDYGGGHATLDFDATIYALGLGRVF